MHHSTTNLGSNAVFDTEALLGLIEAGKTVERYRKCQKIFSQGDVADTVFFIHKGKVKVTVLSEHGKEAVVGIFLRRAVLGEGCLRGTNCVPLRATPWKNARSLRSQKPHARHPRRGAEIRPVFHFLSAVAKQPDRRRPDRPALQFSERRLARCSCCSPISARKAMRRRCLCLSVRRRWRK